MLNSLIEKYSQIDSYKNQLNKIQYDKMQLEEEDSYQCKLIFKFFEHYNILLNNELTSDGILACLINECNPIITVKLIKKQPPSRTWAKLSPEHENIEKSEKSLNN